MGFWGHAQPWVREVWADNLDVEVEALNSALAGHSGAIVAFDTEFPGLVRQGPRWVDTHGQYEVLRENIDALKPIQLGVAVSSADGATLFGVWSFNLRFDLAVDTHQAASVNLLRNAGLLLESHAAHGIAPVALSQRLKDSPLFGPRGPLWVAFAGTYDWGFLVKMVTAGRPLPEQEGAFEELLCAVCPRRLDLQEHLPAGSLDSLARCGGVLRHGAPHTAGSDALLTLGLFMRWCNGGFSAFDTAAMPYGRAPLAGYPAGSLRARGDAWREPVPVERHRHSGPPAAAAAQGGPEPAREATPPAQPPPPPPPPVPAAPPSLAADSPPPAGAVLRRPAHAGTLSLRRSVAEAVSRESSEESTTAGGALKGKRSLHRFETDISLCGVHLLCCVGATVLCSLFPSSADTLIFLPLQVLGYLLLVRWRILPNVPQRILSSYLTGCCCRLCAVFIRLCWDLA